MKFYPYFDDDLPFSGVALGNDPRGSGGFDLTFKTLSEKCNSPSVNRGNVESHDGRSFPHDRSVDRALRNDFLNLSTNRE